MGKKKRGEELASCFISAFAEDILANADNLSVKSTSVLTILLLENW